MTFIRLLLHGARLGPPDTAWSSKISFQKKLSKANLNLHEFVELCTMLLQTSIRRMFGSFDRTFLRSSLKFFRALKLSYRGLRDHRRLPTLSTGSLSNRSASVSMVFVFHESDALIVVHALRKSF